jgi:glycosyltransferase involved in cell wall biosynthesis
MSSRRVIALLGSRDAPTDAVEEYCLHLGEALSAHDIHVELRRVPWEIHGWPQSLHALRLQAASWRGTWVLAQYTALAWSARGFPWRFIQALRILAAAGARIVVVYHDVEPYAGTRLIDRLRRISQVRTMRHALDFADVAIFTVPPAKLSWLARTPEKAAFIPVGPNLPISSLENAVSPRKNASQIPTIGVFSITGGEAGARETREIISAVRFASEKLGRLRLAVFGRYAELRESDLREGLRDVPVKLSVEGVLEADQIVQKLSACDVLLFVRGPISSRRSSAIAGIACGLPLIAFEGSETAAPITDAGVVLVVEIEGTEQKENTRQERLNAALVRVLADAEYRAALAARSRLAYEQHFSWDSIAARFAAILRDEAAE